MKSVATGILAVFICLISLTATAGKPSEINVAYFKGWPTPNQFSQIKQGYDAALGIPVNWIPFNSGQQMNAAMASGQIHIAYSQGHVPFVVGVTSGIDLTMVGVAVAYPENDLCIVRDDAGIDRSNASQLEGRKIATPIGNPTHYRLLKVLSHLGVDLNKVELLPMNDGKAATEALKNGEVVMACAYGGHLREMMKLGKPLLSGAEQEKIGLRIFDVVTAPTKFVEEHPTIVQAFMDVTEASNAQWAKNADIMISAIARAADMDRDAARSSMSEFQFPSAEEQKSPEWMGSLVSDYSKQVADFFVEQGQLEKSLESYDQFISTQFLR